MKQTLIINYSLPGMNEIIKASKEHWGAYSKMKKDLTLAIGLEIKAQRIKPITQAKFEFHWTEKRRNRDKDNIVVGRKFILDALVEMNILTNDGWRYITGWTDNFSIGEPQVKVIIIGHCE